MTMIDTRRRTPPPARRVQPAKLGRYFFVVADPGTGKSGRFVTWGTSPGRAYAKAEAQYRDEQHTPANVALVCTLSHRITPKVGF